MSFSPVHGAPHPRPTRSCVCVCVRVQASRVRAYRHKPHWRPNRVPTNIVTALRGSLATLPTHK